MNTRLIYIAGASGVGKDSLMQYARQRLNGGFPIQFAHRYITRDVNEAGENHIALSPPEFRLRRDSGLFALHWESHGLYYGIGIEIDAWIAAGLYVVVNGSRQYLPLALARYPEMIPIIIEADPETIRRRLETRGREEKPDIDNRIKHQPTVPADLPGLIRIPNNGTLAEGGDTLLKCLHGLIMVK
jgi:ribose 1,5-bisphosphokinase